MTISKSWGDDWSRHILWIHPEGVDEVIQLVGLAGKPLLFERRGEKFAIELTERKDASPN